MSRPSDLSWAIDLFESLPDDAVVTDAIAIVAFVVMPETDNDDNGVSPPRSAPGRISGARMPGTSSIC